MKIPHCSRFYVVALVVCGGPYLTVMVDTRLARDLVRDPLRWRPFIVLALAWVMADYRKRVESVVVDPNGELIVPTPNRWASSFVIRLTVNSYGGIAQDACVSSPAAR
jgi:hypothetical protein